MSGDCDSVSTLNALSLFPDIPTFFSTPPQAIADFQKKCRNPKSNLEEVYVMGHRLTAFLGKALPQHPNYKKTQVTSLRNKSLRQLDWIKAEMETLALKIDEEQLNTFITMDFDPSLDDDDDDDEESLICTSSHVTDGHHAKFELGFAVDFSSPDDTDHWQDFTGWNLFGFSSNNTAAPQTEQHGVIPPATVETDSSRSQDVSLSHDLSFSTDDPPSEELDHASHDEEEPEPDRFVTFQDDDDVSNHDDDDDDSSDEESDLETDDDDDTGPSEFFRMIASEEVHYESDSEAVDSWAPDGESHARSCASSGTTLTYDPARIAFREIMNKVVLSRDLGNHLDWSNGTANNSSTNPRPTLNPSQPLSVRYIPPKTVSTHRQSSSSSSHGGNQGDSWANFIAVARPKRHRISSND